MSVLALVSVWSSAGSLSVTAEGSLSKGSGISRVFGISGSSGRLGSVGTTELRSKGASSSPTELRRSQVMPGSPAVMEKRKKPMKNGFAKTIASSESLGATSVGRSARSSDVSGSAGRATLRAGALSARRGATKAAAVQTIAARLMVRMVVQSCDETRTAATVRPRRWRYDGAEQKARERVQGKVEGTRTSSRISSGPGSLAARNEAQSRRRRRHRNDHELREAVPVADRLRPRARAALELRRERGRLGRPRRREASAVPPHAILRSSTVSPSFASSVPKPSSGPTRSTPPAPKPGSR